MEISVNELMKIVNDSAKHARVEGVCPKLNRLAFVDIEYICPTTFYQALAKLLEK